MSTRLRLARSWLAATVAVCLVVSCGDGSQPDEAGGEGEGGGAPAIGADPSDELRVAVEDGVVEGDLVGGSRRFLKIPYAAPPVGERRWRAPARPRPWDGVRHATRFASACPQNASAQGPASRDEDCLYANVWSPAPAPRDAPVMVWIHGGGNFAGSAADLVPGTEQRWYDGQFLASRQDVVVVTFNYRLGPLGFFPLPALADEGSPLGNQGLLDQRRLLEWVQDNIAAFGGDPGNVTIFGESAGSADVCYHVASPGSRGLFHRAISQSGGCTWNDLPVATTGGRGDRGDKAASMEAFAAAAGCDQSGAALVRCLRGLPTEQLMRHAEQPEPSRGDVIGAADWSFGVVVDGEDGVLPTQPRRLFDRNQIADVPYLLGSNEDEGQVFVFSLEVATQEQYAEQVRRRFPDIAAEVLRRYPASDFGGDHQAALAAAVGDSGLICGTTDTARRAAAAGLPVYMYNFDIPWAINPEALRSTHAAEMSHVFGNPIRPDEASRAVGEAMTTYWAAFAATGDPNDDDAPATWPTFEAGDGGDRRLQLDGEFEVVEDFRADQCRFWRNQLSAAED
jgi:para-nitrobenzyl esterase